MTLTSRDRAAINRANSQKSTGPKTQAGKAKSKLNATRHGLTGQIVLLPSEDFNQYTAFIAGFHAEHSPLGPTETQLVQVVATSSWKYNRAAAWEDHILSLQFQHHAAQIDPANPPQVVDALGMACSVSENMGDLMNLGIYQQRVYRTMTNALEKLKKLQAERHAREKVEMADAARFCQMHDEQEQQRQNREIAAHPDLPPSPKTAYQPRLDGFVLSIAQIQAHLHLEHRLQELDTYEEALAAAA